jgi:outer membrane protein TolC
MRRLSLFLLLVASPATAQDTLRLPALQSAAIRQDPRLRQLELQEAQTALRLRTLAAERLPQLSASGEATQQSEVAALPLNIPNAEVPQPPKDRIEAALNATLLLYEGGALEARRAAERAQLAAARAEIAAALFPLRSEVSRFYFGALLYQESAREVAALIEDLEARLAVVRSQVGAGAALPGDTAALRAEMLRAEQQRDEFAAERRASLAVLEELTGRAISDEDVLSLPELANEPGDAAPAEVRAHPQYAVFAARRESLDRQAAVIRARSRPQASAFGKLAYGRPGLQQFSDELHEYWLAGVRVQWSAWDWGALLHDPDLDTREPRGPRTTPAPQPSGAFPAPPSGSGSCFPDVPRSSDARACDSSACVR